MSTARKKQRELSKLQHKITELIEPLQEELDRLPCDLILGKVNKGLQAVEWQEKVHEANAEYNYFATKYNRKAKHSSAEFNTLKKLAEERLDEREKDLFLSSVAVFANEKYGILIPQVEEKREEAFKCRSQGFTPEEAAAFINKKIKE